MHRRTLIAGVSLLGLGHARAQGPGGRVGQHPPPVVPGRGPVGPGGLPGPTLDLNFINGLALDPRLSFTRASTATYFDNTGTLQSAAANAPRLDFDPVTHAARGLLIEETRTNLLLNSATLSTQSVTTAAVAYALSFYGTGTIVLSGAFAGTLVGSGAFPTRSTLLFTSTASTLTATVTGSVLDAQLEAGAFVTSAILSGGTAGVRAIDSATMPTGTWFNAAAGTLAFEFDTPRSIGSPGVTGGLAKTGDFNNSFYLTGNGVNAFIAGVGVGTNGSGAVFPGSNKTAAAYASGTLAVAMNGFAPGTFALAAGPFPWINTLSIGDAPWASGNSIDGHMRRVRYWPRALSAAELQGATQ